MARSKRIAHSTSERMSVKDDLAALRNSIQRTQQTTSRLPSPLNDLKTTTVSRRSRTNKNKPIKSSNSFTPTIVSKQRQLLQDIMYRDTLKRPCWYHRMHGSAAIECIAPCSFVRLVPVLQAKIKEIATSTNTLQSKQLPVKV